MGSPSTCMRDYEVFIYATADPRTGTEVDYLRIGARPVGIGSEPSIFDQGDRASEWL